MTSYTFNFDAVHPTWRDCLKRGLDRMNPDYLNALTHSTQWLPGPQQIFNALSLPMDKVNYVLFGESPYPRKQSANGYAFWDADVHELWSPTGFSKKVNRATSMRNILKMFLVADGYLPPHATTQENIAALDKHAFIQTNDELFQHFLQQGFLLLNATLVLSDQAPQKDARAWQPCLKELLTGLIQQRPQVKLLLLGRIATTIDQLLPDVPVDKLYVEHPYNISFINNAKVLDFFKPFKLLMNQ